MALWLTEMTIKQLVWSLLKMWWGYGNIRVHMTIEFEGKGQWTAPLGEIAISPGTGRGRPARVELLSEGFT